MSEVPGQSGHALPAPLGRIVPPADIVGEREDRRSNKPAGASVCGKVTDPGRLDEQHIRDDEGQVIHIEIAPHPQLACAAYLASAGVKPTQSRCLDLVTRGGLLGHHFRFRKFVQPGTGFATHQAT
jgi:hypothetical protein